MSTFGPRQQRRRRWPLVFLAATAIAACGSSPNTSSSPAAAQVKAANGVRIPRVPTRIVSLSPSATEDLYAVGAGKQVVAVDQFSTYPANAPRTSMSAYQPSAEAIAKYRPDLVVTYVAVNNLGALLAKLHIPLLVESRPATLSGAYAQLGQLGAATGHRRRAAEVIAAMRRRVAAVLASVRRPRRPLSVYHELDQTYFSASSSSFVGQIYSLLGLRNIADRVAKGNPFPQLSSEYIIASDPDLIVLADSVCCGQSARTVAARPGWKNIKAVRDHAVLPVNDAIASQWGPRIVSFLQTVADEVRKLEAAK